MRKNHSLSTLRFLLSTPLVIGLFSSAVSQNAAHADTIRKYHRVSDVIGNNSPRGAIFTGLPGLCSISSSSIYSGATAATIEFTAWDLNGRSNSTTLLRGTQSTGSAQIATYSLGGASLSENQWTASFSNLSGLSSIGIYCYPNPFGGSSNVYVKNRNYRVRYTGVSFTSPTEVSYANIADGGTYASLPSVADVQTLVSDVGFRGYATPDYSNRGITDVYLSLERNSDGLYWSGTAWSHLRINHLANKKVINSSSKRVEWTKTGGWPTGTNLPSGSYTLRTMATEGSSSAPPGTQNTITFTIGTAALSSSAAAG